MSSDLPKESIVHEASFHLACSYNNIGVQLDHQGKAEESLHWFKKAIDLAPDAVEPHYNRANALRRLEKFDLAQLAYHQTLKLNPKHFWARYGLLLCFTPRLYMSQESILSMRKGYLQALEDLEKEVKELQTDEIARAAEAVGRFYPYFLAYQGLCDLELQKRHGQMIHQIMARRYPHWVLPLAKPSLEEGDRLRVGFVSWFFVDSSVWKVPLSGWLKSLDRTRFETFGYMPMPIGQTDACTEKAKEWLDHFVMDGFEALCRRVKDDRLHALIFTDIGMETVSTKMATLRLAPLQCTCLGHPETTGLPTIDYFLSSEEMETSQSVSHYSEKLVELPHLSIDYTPYAFDPEPFDLASYGLDEGAIKYLCCQHLSKYLPQYDFIFVEIALRVPQAQFIFIARPQEVVEAFKKRLALAFEKRGLKSSQFVRVIPVLSSRQFAYLCARSELFLDSFEWSGFNTTLEALKYGLPVITLPGSLARGRHSYAILKRLGLEETIAKSIDHYLELAIELGHTRDWREDLSKKIIDRFPLLCDDQVAVRALEKWLLSHFQ